MAQNDFPYTTAAAFRAALKDRFTDIVRSDPRYSLDELQRQFAYDRALARIFTSPDADRWVLKGAGALLARLRLARHSKDVDMFFAEEQAEVASAVTSLRRALNQDLGDFFGFDVERVTALQEEAKGSRVHVGARLGPKLFAVFHLDVVVGTTMTGKPDLVAPLTPLNITGLVRPQYRTFPVVDHLADKLCAVISTYSPSGRAQASSRIKDLLDIALIAATQRISGPALRVAIVENATQRGLNVPDQFVVPDPPSSRAGYPRVASDARGHTPSYDEAVALACALFDPVLSDSVTGDWDPVVTQWQIRKVAAEGT